MLDSQHECKVTLSLHLNTAFTCDWIGVWYRLNYFKVNGKYNTKRNYFDNSCNISLHDVRHVAPPSKTKYYINHVLNFFLHLLRILSNEKKIVEHQLHITRSLHVKFQIQSFYRSREKSCAEKSVTQLLTLIYAQLQLGWGITLVSAINATVIFKINYLQV